MNETEILEKKLQELSSVAVCKYYPLQEMYRVYEHGEALTPFHVFKNDALIDAIEVLNGKS